MANSMELCVLVLILLQLGITVAEFYNHHLHSVEYLPEDSRYKRSSSTGGSSDAPFNIKDYYADRVISTKGKKGGSRGLDDPSIDPWNVDCNGRNANNGYKYAAINALRAVNKNLEYIKCIGPKTDVNFHSFKLDLKDNKNLDLYEKHGDYREAVCPEGHLLTALWSDLDDFQNIKYGKCTKLDVGEVVKDTCDKAWILDPTSGGPPGSKIWEAECREGSAAVGLGLVPNQSIEYLKCCLLSLPIPNGPMAGR